MARRTLTAIVLALAGMAIAPVGAQARVPCPGEQSAPTAANMAQVSDAVFCLTNQIRTSYGLPAFRRDARLDTAARMYSEDMASRNFFGHTSPEGSSPTDRAAAQGYPSQVGENIAYGYPTARDVVLGWMSSTGHCQNILGEARDIGVGTANPSKPYYTQDFGDYDFGSGGAAAAGCPYTVDLDTLATPDAPSPIADGQAAATAGQRQPSAPAVTIAAPVAGVALGRLGLSSPRLRAGGGGSLVSYTLSAPATVTFRVERAGAGGRWRALRGRLTHTSGQGANSFRFRARLQGHALASGRYRLVAVATCAAGTATPARRARFLVVGG
jgi:uncharacterized protein YkwD